MPTITDEALFTLVTTALGLQFAAFGWRIIREIQLADEGRREVVPVSDWLITLTMGAIVTACVVAPLAGYRDQSIITRVLAIAYIVLAAHPLNIAAHYRLFSRAGRSKYSEQHRDLPYVTDQEWVTLPLTLAAIIVTLWLWR